MRNLDDWEKAFIKNLICCEISENHKKSEGLNEVCSSNESVGSDIYSFDIYALNVRKCLSICQKLKIDLGIEYIEKANYVLNS